MTDIGELPQGSVTVTPPAEEANTKIEFSNGTWTTVPDFIGIEYWTSDGAKHTISGVRPYAGRSYSNPASRYRSRRVYP